MRKNFGEVMKATKIFRIVIVYVLLLMVTGCGQRGSIGVQQGTVVGQQETAIGQQETAGEQQEEVVHEQSENAEANVEVNTAEDTAEDIVEDTDSQEKIAIDATDENEENSDTQVQGTMIRPAVKAKGIYVTGPTAGSERMEEMINLVADTEMNAMVIDIKNDEGNITYHMEQETAAGMDACIRYVKDMPGLLERLHEQGIYVIGRIVCFKDPVFAKNYPECALCKPDGTPVADANGLAFVNPYRQEVWDYLCSLAETAVQDGFDEIQFDYVRFPIGEDANAADYGVDLEEYPRIAGLTDFFQYVQKRLHEQGIVYGADLFGTVIGSDTDRDRTGQDYKEICAMADVVSPMVYPSHYAGGTFGLSVPDAEPYTTVKEAMDLSVEQLSDKGEEECSVVRPWLQCFNATWVAGHITYDAVQIREQIQAVYDAGYEEWLLWNASNHYDQVAEALNAMNCN